MVKNSTKRGEIPLEWGIINLFPLVPAASNRHAWPIAAPTPTVWICTFLDYNVVKKIILNWQFLLSLWLVYHRRFKWATLCFTEEQMK